MDKPTTKAALVRYLTANPYLRWEYPESLVIATMVDKPRIEGRKFLKVQGGRFAFEKPCGSTTFLGECKASDFIFHDDHFEVKFDPSWNTDETMKYYYLDEPAPDPIA